MNKSQLVDALAERLGDRRVAASAVDGLIETIVDAVRSGNAVSLTGFGVFESRARAARLARNPRTGEAVEVPATTVPAFRPGTGFRTAVGGGEPEAPRAASPRRSRAAAAPAPAEVAEPVTEPGVASGRRSSKATPEKPAKGGPAAAEPIKAEPAKAGKANKVGKAGKAGKVEPTEAEPAKAKKAGKAEQATTQKATPKKKRKAEAAKDDDKDGKARKKAKK